METTVYIDDAIYQRAEAKAAREGITVTEFIEDAVRLRLEQTSAEQSEAEAKRAEFIERLQQLFQQADERDRLKEGRLIPLTREEIYAERLDRFR